MSILDTAEYRRLALLAAGVDPCDIPCILDTAAWRRLMLKALYDLSQGGGGSPGYINGSVQFYTDLPVTVGTPAVNTAYLVRENSGVWFINRKPAGIYVRLFNNGNLNDWDYAGTFPEVNDAQYFRIYDSADPTREVAFNVSGVAAATTRTLTVPNANGTIARTEDFAAPPAIGNTTRNTVAATTMSATGAITGAVAGTTSATSGCNGFQIPVPAAGGASAVGMYGAFTAGSQRAVIFGANTSGSTSTIADFSASGLVANSIQNTPIGSTTPAAGSFTTLNATGTTELVNGGTTAGPFRLYNISSAANTNYERGFMRWSSSVLQIGTEKLGTGSARALQFQTDGATRFTFSSGGSLFIGDGSAQANNFFGWSGNGGFRAQQTSTGVITLLNWAETDFNRLQFGGTTSSFPALKRSSTTLQVRLANDSDFAPFECAGLTLNGNLTASTRNIVTDTTTGTRIGTATTQLLGFWNAAPSAQPAAVADATDAASTQARLNDLLARLRTIGIIAT